MAEMDVSINAKYMKLAQQTEDLISSQKKKEALTHKMAQTREEIESGQRRIRKLLQEKDDLENELKRREAAIKVLKRKNSSIAASKEHEVVRYQKQLESIRQELEAERKAMYRLQEEFQRKRVEVAEKMKDIQYLTEARDRANCELEREREKAEQKSKELTAAAASHTAHTVQLQVCGTCNLMAYNYVYPLISVNHTVAVSITERKQTEE